MMLLAANIASLCCWLFVNVMYATHDVTWTPKYARCGVCRRWTRRGSSASVSADMPSGCRLTVTVEHCRRDGCRGSAMGVASDRLSALGGNDA